MKTLVTKNLKEHDTETGMNYMTFGCKHEKEFGKVIYQFVNACDELVYGVYDMTIKRGKDGNRYLVLSNGRGEFEFLFPDGSKIEFAELNKNALPIGINCQIADDYSIAISGAMSKDYENSIHNL
jgi:hypothetical protein